ncbi:MAG: AAA family ATPase, partial [Leifsonia sp.]|uniref:AAA family ATPase n=1 Tax=Leifsonia sp. TaxID=1870902 RepID=UPI003F8003DF
VSITDGAIVAAANLADRYIQDRFLPDKAIDLIDEAGARLRLSILSAPPELREFDDKIAAVRSQKEAAIEDQDLEKAASLRAVEKNLLGERLRLEKQWRSGDVKTTAEVDEGLIAEVLAQATGIPVFKLTEEESARLVYMEKALHQRVIGQEEASAALSRTIRRTRAGLKDPKRPSGSFIFAGPTGVGKTELAKALAEFLFDDESAMISLDMSEYGEKHTVSRLFGAPPGFVGFEEGGQLTEKVRRKPFSVVLFDEIEKAHPDIFNSLLQILEEGRLTDGQGRVVDFKNTVIIMTTNLGTKDISGGPVGFQIEGDPTTGYDRMRGKVYEELKKNFKPEFLNRVDEIIVFPQLNKTELLQIVDLFIKRLSDRLLDRDMTIELTVPAKERLIEVGFDPTLGARPLRRAVQHEIEDRLSEKILHGELNAGDHVHVDFADGEFVFTTSARAESIGAGVNATAAIGTGPATPDLAAND